MRKLWTVWLLMIIMLLGVVQPSMAGEARLGFKIEVDGKTQDYTARTVTIEVKDEEIAIGDMPAIILEGRTLVPIKEVFESKGFGAKVEWNHERKEVTVTYNGNTIVVAINSNIAYVNGEKKQIDPDNAKVVPKLVRDTGKQYAKTMIPLRFVSETLGYKVGWNPDTYTASITAPESVPVPVPVPEPTPDPLPEPTPEPVPLPQYDSNIEDAINTNNNFILKTGNTMLPLPTALKNNPIIWTDGNSNNTVSLSKPEAYANFAAVNGTVVKLQSIKYLINNSRPRFEVSASGAISDIKVQTMDKKVVLDVVNAQNALTQQTYTTNPVASAVRSSQFAIDPMTTRIVIDLKSNDERCQVTLSEDRKTLIVEFEPKTIHTIELGQSHLGDYIRVSGMAPTSVKTFRMSEPNRVVIDFVGTKSTIGWKEAAASGQFVTGIRTDQYNAETTRIVALTDGAANYEVIQNGSETWVQFTQTGLKNFEYSSNDINPMIRFNQGNLSFDKTNVQIIDDYENMTYTFILPQDVSGIFGNGKLVVDDRTIDNIELKQDPDGRSRIVIKQLEYYEYKLEVTAKGIVIAGYKPKVLYDKIVVIDAGHGGTDPGAVAGGVHEKSINLLIANNVKALFDSSASFKVYYTRTSDVNKSLQYRTDLANTLEADIFVSIHNNAMNTSSFQGMETLYMPGGSTSKLSSISIAKIFHDTLLPIVEVADRGLKPRDGLYVLRHTKMPAIILELGFMTNPSDLAKLTNPEVQKRVAEGIYQATETVFNRFPTTR